MTQISKSETQTAHLHWLRRLDEPIWLRHPTDPGRKPTPADGFEHGRAPYRGIVIMMTHLVARGVNARWRIEALVRQIKRLAKLQ